MKKIILVLLLMVAWIDASYAQVQISSSDLVNTSWQLKIDNKRSDKYYKYDQKKVTKSETGYADFINSYYLTNVIPTQFDQSKVGTITKGCYLVKYHEKSKSMHYLTIEYFNKEKGVMILKYKNKDFGDLYTTLILSTSNWQPDTKN